MSFSPEMTSTALVAAFTGVLWIPIILNRLREMGLWNALKNPQPDVRPEAAWACRLTNAHRNAIENLVVFAPLALIVQMQGIGDGLTALWCWIFVAARVAHAVIYTLGVPLLRTIAFTLGFIAQAILAARILDVI